MKDILLAQVAPHRQQHLLAHWDTLDEVERSRLAQQINDIDWTDYARLRKLHSGTGDDAEAIKQHWQAAAARPNGEESAAGSISCSSPLSTSSARTSRRPSRRAAISCSNVLRRMSVDRLDQDFDLPATE